MQEMQMMQICLNIAKQNYGRTDKNPAVGAIIYKSGVIFQGVTGFGGSPHAEASAILNAQSYGFDCKGSTMFVTLEPCAHYGKNPPCVEAIINAGIAKVVVGVGDPDKRVNGNGIKQLEASGIKVSVLEMEEVQKFYKPYFIFKKEKRPYVALKIASSLDGKIALANGKSKWITSEQARTYTNFLRSRFNGILIGANTLQNDSPTLDCRISGLEDFSPKKFVASSNAFEGYISVSGSVTQMLEEVYTNEVQSILVEGGANLISQFIREDIFDELILIQAPVFLGSDAKSAVEKLNLEDLPLQKIRIEEQKIIDQNIFTKFVRHV